MHTEGAIPNVAEDVPGGIPVAPISAAHYGVGCESRNRCVACRCISIRLFRRCLCLHSLENAARTAGQQDAFHQRELALHRTHPVSYTHLTLPTKRIV